MAASYQEDDLKKYIKNFAELLDLRNKEAGDVQDELKREIEDLKKQIADLKTENAKIREKTSEDYHIQENIISGQQKEPTKDQTHLNSEKNDLLNNLHTKLSSIDEILKTTKQKTQQPAVEDAKSKDIAQTSNAESYLKEQNLSAKISDMPVKNSDKNHTAEEPLTVEILQQKAVKAESANQEEEFFKTIEKAIELAPGNAKNYAIRAEHNMAKNAFQEAFNDVNKVIELHPNNASAHYFRGVIHYNLQKYSECSKDMEKALTLKTEEKDVYKYLGICNFKLEKFADTVKHLTKALKAGINDNDVYYYKAVAEFKIGDLNSAIDDMSKVIDNNPKDYKNYLIRAKYYDEKRIFKKAKKDYKKALKLNSSLEILTERAQFFSKYEKYKQALKDYSAAISLDKTNAELYKQRGFIYQKLKKSKYAKNDFTQALKLNPQTGVFIENEKTNHTSAQKNDAPAKPVSKSANEPQENHKNEPSDISILFNRANINYKNKKYNIALEDAGRIISQDPNYAQAYLLRASIYNETGNNGKALEDLNKTIELAPASFLAYYKRADIHFLQNNDDLSFADFSKTIELNPKFFGGYMGVAKIYAKRGDKEKAIANYTLAKQYDIKSSKIINSEIKALSENK